MNKFLRVNSFMAPDTESLLTFQTTRVAVSLKQEFCSRKSDPLPAHRQQIKIRLAVFLSHI